MGFDNCNLQKLLTSYVKGARQDKAPLLVLVLNTHKSVSVVHNLHTLFWLCIHILPNKIYLDACFIRLLHSQFLINPLRNGEVFIYDFQSIGHSFAVNDVIQDGLDSVLDITDSFELLTTWLNVVTKLVTESALTTIV